MKTVYWTILVTGLTACGVVFANDPAKQPVPASFADIDTNADLYIDKQEFDQYKADMRAKMAEKFPGGPRGGSERGGNRADELFDSADTDGDGLLNEYEFANLQDSMHSFREEMRERWSERKRRD